MAKTNLIKDMKNRLQKRKDRYEGENYVKDVHGKWMLKPGTLHQKTKDLPYEERKQIKAEEKTKMNAWILRKKAKDGK